MLLLSLLVTSLASGIAIGIFLYFWRQGQFDDVEDVKYQMFRNEED